MDIFEIIKADHAEIRSFLNEVIDQTSVSIPAEKRALEKPSDWEEAFHDLKRSMIAHSRAEEAVLYRLFEQIAPGRNLKGTKMHEHHLVEETLSYLENLNPRDDAWGDRLGLLRNLVESHQAEEESQTFELLRPVIDEKTSHRLASEFQAIRDRISESRYRPTRRTPINPLGLDL